MQMDSYEVMTKIARRKELVKSTNWPQYVGKQSAKSVSGYKVYVTTSFLPTQFNIRLLGRRSWYHLLEY